MVREFNKKKFRQPKIYYSKKDNSKTGSANTKKILYQIFLSVILLLLLVYFAFFSNIFEIKDIIVEDNELISDEEVKNVIPVGINIFILHSKKLEQEITDKIPEIKQAKIYKGIPNAIKISVLEYEKSLIWKTGDKYYLISSRGVAYKDITDNLSDFSALPKVEDIMSLSVKRRQRIVSPSFVAFVQNIYNNFFDYSNIDPDYFTVDETTVDVNLQTKANFYVKFDSMRSSDKQLEDLKTVLIEARDEINEYIDLRVSGWAYYK